MDYKEQLEHLIKNALREDIGDGDHSTISCIDAGAKGKAILKIKEGGILAGMEVAEAIFKYAEPGIVFTAHKKDGDKCNPAKRLLKFMPKFIQYFPANAWY